MTRLGVVSSQVGRGGVLLFFSFFLSLLSLVSNTDQARVWLSRAGQTCGEARERGGVLLGEASIVGDKKERGEVKKWG